MSVKITGDTFIKMININVTLVSQPVITRKKFLTGEAAYFRIAYEVTTHLIFTAYTLTLCLWVIPFNSIGRVEMGDVERRAR